MSLIRPISLFFLLSPALLLAQGVEPDYGVSVFDCAQLTWMQDCSKINRQIQESPNSHHSVRDPNGLEFNFPPGTPGVMMRHLIERSPETASALADYLEGHIQVGNEAADLMKAELARRGGALKGTRTAAELDAAMRTPFINHENIEVFIFYDSRHKATHMLLNDVRRLANRQKELRISIIQVDNNPSALASLNRTYNMQATILEGEKRAAILSQVKDTPAFWVQDKRTRQNHISAGYIPLEQIESSLIRIANQ